MSEIAPLSRSEAAERILSARPDLRSDVDYLKSWLLKQRHLPPVTDDQLLTFLNSCNNSLEATKSCIDAYFTIKTAAPEFFSNRDPLSAEMQHIAKVVDMCALTRRSKEGHSYIFGRISDPDVSKYNPDSATKLLFMVIDATLRHSVATPGIVVVYDMKGVQFQHIAKASPSSLKKYMLYVQEAMPVKLKGMHVINCSPIISKIMMLLRPFMNKEHLQLLHFHTAEQQAQFHELVPQAVMPQDYGGEDDTVEELCRRTQKQLESYRAWFLAGEQQCRVDESKREGRATRSELIGLEGSFKRLDID